jgi:MFS transporter, DHA1 family, tetracycline resistance protein
MNKKATIYFIFITLVIDVIGFGLIIPVFPKLIAELKGVGISEASKYGGYLLFVFAIAQFIFSPLIGALSDKFGRRPVLLLALLAFAIEYIVLATTQSYNVLVITRILTGITGASFTTANAYIADISTDADRAKNFGMVGAAFGIGFIVGPLVGGLLGQYGSRVPFYFAAVFSLLNLLYGYFVLPESLAKENRRELEYSRLNPVSSLVRLGTFKNIRWLVMAYFLLSLGSHAVHSNWSYYGIYKFKWNEATIGYTLAVVGLLVGIVQASLAQKVANKIGTRKAVIIGFMLYTIGMLLFAFAPSTLWMMIFLIPYCLGGIGMPNLTSLLVKSVPDNEQGELQGSLTSMVSIATILGPLVMTSLFAYSTNPINNINFAGAPFILGGLFMGLALLIVFMTSNFSSEVRPS